MHPTFAVMTASTSAATARTSSILASSIFIEILERFQREQPGEQAIDALALNSLGYQLIATHKNKKLSMCCDSWFWPTLDLKTLRTVWEMPIQPVTTWQAPSMCFTRAG